MRLQKIIWIVLTFFSIPLMAQTVAPLSGYIYDRDEHTVINDVNIQADSVNGTISDSDGFFRLNLRPGKHTLTISHVGYFTIQKEIQIQEKGVTSLKIFLIPRIIGLKETIVVEGETENPLDKNNNKWLNSTDDIMERFEGVNTMKRANFATEPVIRGSSAGQIAIVIDDMKMFHACIDRMDPVSAYIEVENLEKMELSKGAFNLTNSSTIGGTLNFITSNARLNQPFVFQTEAGYESVSNLSRVRSSLNYAVENWAVRASFSAKNSNDYYAGNQQHINNSGYKKNNYTLNVLRKVGEKQSLRFNYIGDNAWSIGYPALIMDASKTVSHLASLQYNIAGISHMFYALDLKTYYTHVDHWMDDYKRSVDEIKNRVVMPNMYMPMFGYSETIGTIIKATFLPARDHFSRLIFDYYRLNAFADMDMFALEDNLPPAYLVNIPGARLDNFALTLDHSWLITKKVQLHTNIRSDYSNRNIQNAFGKRQLQAMWENSASRREYTANSFSVSATYSPDEKVSVNLNLADTHRLPSHMENYGYLLYNVMDGYFYSGNPRLTPEHSRQIELRTNINSANFYLSTAVFYNDIYNYISGRLIEDEFKLYTNFDRAYLSGFETSVLYKINQHVNLKSSFSYTYGFIDDINEVMPYIPPFQGSISGDYTISKFWFEVRGRFAADQNLAATKSTLEDKTPGYFLWDLHSRFHLSEQWEIKSGIENIFDTMYHEHLSINNLPARGRNIYLGLNYNYN